MAQPHQVEVVAEALERFLGDVPRKLEGQEALARLRSVFAQGQTVAPAEEDLQYRIMVLWRLSRATARLTGICGEDEPLDIATEMSPSPWREPIKPKLAPSEQAVLRRAAAGELLHHLGEGLPLLPPEEPELAERWCEAMSILVCELGIESTEGGRRGLIGLLNPKTCYLAGVNARNVIALEELLIDEAQKLMIECGERPAIDHLREQYGFTRKEAISMVRLARADLLQTAGSSIEEDRAIMVAQLKDVAARCKEEMNTDRELKTLKQLASVQGLTRSEPDDQARDFVSIIAAVARKQDAQLANRPPPTQLAEYTIIKPVSSESDDDAEAEALYDLENPQ